MSGLRQRVFISYSHQPAEDSAFVRDLARTLRAQGFEPWLDEEQIPGAADFESEIRKAISASRHGLFVITSRWLQRPYTRMELNLFSRHDPKTHYRVAINREGIDPLEVAAQLQQLHIIEWPRDDPEPEARLWEVQSALTRRPPGPREEWAEKGRQLIIAAGRSSVARGPSGPVTELPDSAAVLCPTVPTQALLTPEKTVLLTDGPECLCVGSDGGVRSLTPLSSRPGCAIIAHGVAIVAQYTRMLARLRDGDWEYQSLDAPVLAVAAGPQGVIVGDAAGSVSLLSDSDGDRRTTAVGSPVVDVAATDGGAVALCHGGTFGQVVWEGERLALDPVALPAAFECPVGLFALPDASRVGVFSAESIAILEAASGRVRVGKARFPDGVRQVLPLGRHPGYFAVLTDGGRLLHLEASLDSAQPVLLPTEPAEVAGVYRNGTQGLFAWTVGGTAFLVARDRTVRKVAAGDVALVCPAPSGNGLIQVVRWSANRSVRVEQVRSEGVK
jgi:hypothetical protein